MNKLYAGFLPARTRRHFHHFKEQVMEGYEKVQELTTGTEDK
jgi:hypothetical protein